MSIWLEPEWSVRYCWLLLRSWREGRRPARTTRRRKQEDIPRPLAPRTTGVLEPAPTGSRGPKSVSPTPNSSWSLKPLRVEYLLPRRGPMLPVRLLLPGRLVDMLLLAHRCPPPPPLWHLSLFLLVFIYF